MTPAKAKQDEEIEFNTSGRWVRLRSRASDSKLIPRIDTAERVALDTGRIVSSSRRSSVSSFGDEHYSSTPRRIGPNGLSELADKR
jgi:hypothetical protein